MCGRYSLYDFRPLARDFPQLSWESLAPRYNVSPGTTVPIVRMGKDHRIEWVPCHWGFHPAWADKSAPSPINARAETAAEKPYFRDSFRRYRCVFPANGFYEWQSFPGQREKQPWYLSPPEGEMWYFAGLYTPTDPCTAAILVTTANSQMRPLHERMPVILLADTVSTWVDSTTIDPQSLLQPFPHPLSAWKVDRAVNRPTVEDPRLILPVVP